MAARPADSVERPEPGQILLVIHDFTARSTDEISLAKGDRIELVERDDDFGDGWYLGKHLMNGNTGLFPEVYTRPAPRGQPVFPAQANIPRSQPPSVQHASNTPPPAYDSRQSLPAAETDRSPQINRHISASQVLDANKATHPLTTSSKPDSAGNVIPSSPAGNPSPLPTVSGITNAKLQHHEQDSPVMNETLNVIQEHISNMSTPRHSGLGQRLGTDSESEYSAHLDHRLSFINGEETDEEESSLLTSAEVSKWTPSQVAEYLTEVGVEAKHCEVFREQEITGDVLLGMDQTSVFLKEFDLGSVGRRLKTWQKIKALQDEIKGKLNPGSRRRVSKTSGNTESLGDNRSRSNTVTNNTALPRIPSLMDQIGPRQDMRYSQQQGQNKRITASTPLSPALESPTRPIPETRPSAASIRDLHHSRRHSSIDSATLLQPNKSADGTPSGASIMSFIEHKKEPSFDRNWTMGSQSPATRPISAADPQNFVVNEEDDLPGVNRTTPWEFDRGYFSGGEYEGRRRSLLRKRTSASHSRTSSYTDEQRIRTATTTARHSRFGSVDSIREPHLSSASQKYYGISGSRPRPPSVEVSRPLPPPKDAPSPTVTKLEGNFSRVISGSPASPAGAVPYDWLSANNRMSVARTTGLRASSDAVTGSEKSRLMSQDQLPSPRDESIQSPSQTVSSTTSGGPSFDLDSPNNSMSPTTVTPGHRNGRKKSKKETSAYTRGLLKRTPQEAMLDCDYCGWMKKKNTNLMTTWKSRLFILKGRRLSYYYSEDDDQEQGLIDISFHRVLPADSDRITGLHATLTGATSSPTSPSNAHTPTMADTEAAAEPQSSFSKGEGDSMFIFKLVPPRSGLSRAVTFTKPTVHYFAVPNITQGRLWMAALMKATIDRDDTSPIVTTYQQKTISLAKARAMRHRPPALMNLDEKVEEEHVKTPITDMNGLNIRGIIFDEDLPEEDSGISGVSKLDLGPSQSVEIRKDVQLSDENGHSSDLPTA